MASSELLSLRHWLTRAALSSPYCSLGAAWVSDGESSWAYLPAGRLPARHLNGPPGVEGRCWDGCRTSERALESMGEEGPAVSVLWRPILMSSASNHDGPF